MEEKKIESKRDSNRISICRTGRFENVVTIDPPDYPLYTKKQKEDNSDNSSWRVVSRKRSGKQPHYTNNSDIFNNKNKNYLYSRNNNNNNSSTNQSSSEYYSDKKKFETLPPIKKKSSQRLQTPIRSFYEAESSYRMTKGANILSWDCGVKNLCYCFMEDTSESDDPIMKEAGFKIWAWAKINLDASDMKDVIQSMINHLDRRPWMLRVDEVIIEGQVPKNPKMKALSHAIQTYFILRTTPLGSPHEQYDRLTRPNYFNNKKGMPIDFIRPGSKFNCLPQIVIDSYDQANDDNAKAGITHTETAKEKAIRLCFCLIRHTYGSESVEMLHLLKNHKKLDDFCDAMLQAYYKIKVNKTRRKIKKKMNVVIRNEIDLDDVIDKRMDKNSKEPVPDNEPMSRLYDREFDNHMVFFQPKFKDTVIDIEKSTLARAKRIDRLIYDELSVGSSEESIL